MSVQPAAPAGADPGGETQRHLNLLTDQVRQLCLMDLAPAVLYREVLERLLQAVSGLAASYWERNEGGGFQEQCHLNPSQIKAETAIGSGRNELLRQALQQARPAYFRPHQQSPENDDAAGPAECALIVIPVILDQQVAGMLEVWLAPDRSSQALPGVIQFLVRLADLVAVFLCRLRQRQSSDADRILDQVEAFSQRVHGSLHPTEVSFLVANEGRQLTGADRCAVAVRQNKRAKIEAISGVDVIDQRSSLVRHLRTLCDRVLCWGERLVYQGQPDASLPADLLTLLDEYLEESHCKILVILPLRDARVPVDRPATAALIAECFQSATPLDQLTGRLDVIARHATTALYNASTYRAIPLRFLWRPLARVQVGLGGKTKAIVAAVLASLLLLIAALIFVPYPLKMEAKGQLLPERRRWVYAPVPGQVVRFEDGVEASAQVVEGQSLILLYDVQLENRLSQLLAEIHGLQQEIAAFGKQWNAATSERERLRISADRGQKETIRDRKVWELRTLRERSNADPAQPGYFWLRSPVTGTILNYGFRETLTNRLVQPSEPLLRIGDKASRWEIELKIPQKHLGQIVQAFAANDPLTELDVDLLVISAPTRIFKGKLARDKLAGEARPDTDSATSTEPVVLAFVRIDGSDIAAEDRVPPDLLTSGTEVHAKVRCGNRAMGYSLFYGVWEFVFEKVVFFF